MRGQTGGERERERKLCANLNQRHLTWFWEVNESKCEVEEDDEGEEVRRTK